MKTVLLFMLCIISNASIFSQSSISYNTDTLTNDLESILLELESKKHYKKLHFLESDDYDYYRSINTKWFIKDLENALSVIELPFDTSELIGINFIRLYYSTEVMSMWYITAIKQDTHYTFFYNRNEAEIKLELDGIKADKDYVYNFAEKMYKEVPCKDMNEDYITLGKLRNGRLVEYFASQTYHTSDFPLFLNLIEALKH